MSLSYEGGFLIEAVDVISDLPSLTMHDFVITKSALI